jgi:hypothetical protein
LVNALSYIVRLLPIELKSLSRAVRGHGLSHPLLSRRPCLLSKGREMRVEFATVAVALVLGVVWMGLVLIGL